MIKEESILKEVIETAANNNCLFDTGYGWDEYLKKLTAEEKKEFIIINMLAGRDYFKIKENENKLICKITDSIFKEINLYCCYNLPTREIYTCMKDIRKSDTFYDCYKPYFDLSKEINNDK